MPTYTGQTLRITSKSTQASTVPAAFPGTAPGASVTGTYLEFNDFTDFRQYNGDNAIYYASFFTKKSKILIKQIRYTIPNIAGGRLAPGSTHNDYNGGRIYVGRPGTINAGNSDYIDFNLPNLGEWIPVNLITGPLPDIGSGYESFHINPVKVGVWFDTRNIQTNYDGVAYYLQIDLDVLSPFNMLATPE